MITMCRSANSLLHVGIGVAFAMMSGVESSHGQSCNWMPIGPGTGYATDCAIAANGDLIVGTRIDFAGGAEVGFLARWDGATWSSVGGGVNDLIRVVELDANGDILIGGWFTHTTDGLLVNGLARWDGTSWHAYGPEFTPGVRFGYPEAILPLGGGPLVVAGGFLQAGGTVPAGRVALWDGSEWQPMGGLYTPNSSNPVSVQDLALLEDGSIVAGGNFTHADAGTEVNRIARWDGSAWQPLGGGMSTGSVQALLVLPTGDLIAAGSFVQAGGVAANNIARWDGAAWHPLGSGVAGGVYALSLTPDGDVLVGGTFTTAGGVPANRVAKWNPASGQWSALGAGIPNLGSGGSTVLGLAASSTMYFAAGQFQDPNESPLNPRNIAQFRLDAAPPEVSPQPDTSVTACIGGTIVLSAGGVGNGPFSFQWQRLAAPGLWADLEDRVIPIWGTFQGTRTGTLTITNVASSIPRTFRVVVSNACDASPSDTIVITIATQCHGDIDGDGDVDVSDLALLLATFGLCNGDAGFNAAADLDASGCVELSDLAVLLAHFGV